MAPPPDITHLDVYAVAYLAGGLPRLVDTAVVALVRSGRVRVHGPGELAAVDATRRHPVEAAVLDALGPRGHRSVETVRYRVSADPRITDVEHGLLRDGLLVRSALPAALRGRRPTSRPSTGARRALAALRATVPPDDTLRIALDGREALPGGALRSVFERAEPRYVVDRRAIREARRRGLTYSPELAAHQTSGAALGGGIVFGSADGGGGGDGGA